MRIWVEYSESLAGDYPLDIEEEESSTVPAETGTGCKHWLVR